MKYQVIPKILGLVVSVVAVGCAQAPLNQSEYVAKKVEASYFEKVNGTVISQFKTGVNCPSSESELNGTEWKRLSSQAAACVKAQDWAKVEKLGNAIAIHGKLTPWGPYYLSLAAESRKDYPRAIWMLELALKKAPKEGILQYQLGRVNWMMGNDIEALKYLKLASETNPSLIEAHWITGLVALNSDKFSEAESALNRALAMDSKHWPSLTTLAEVKIRTKDWEKAESLLSRAVSLNPQSTKARVALATVQEIGLKKAYEALGTYKELKRQSAQNKLDAPLNFNLDEKIKMIEGALATVPKPQVSSRQPSTQDEKVAK